jgi:hypothetical protein
VIQADDDYSSFDELVDQVISILTELIKLYQDSMLNHDLSQNAA